MNEVVSYSLEGNVAVLTADNPPVNALGIAVRRGLKEGIERAVADDRAEAIALVCAGRTFFAGADISEFGKPPVSPTLREVHEVMEDCPKPIVAGIHGTALGGGLETALACHYRIAVPSARVGLPEVKLGILPGAGGTQRLPRLVGVPTALDFIVQGKLNPAARCHDAGLVDELFEGDAADAGVAYAEKLIGEGRGVRRTRDQDERVAAAKGERQIFARFRQECAKRARGVEAPLAAIDSIENATELPFDEGMRAERQIFVRCVESDQSRAMRHAFFAEREASKIPDVPRDTPTRDVEKVGVVGCGTMGQGITMAFGNAGIPVRVLEVDQEALDAGL
ncbi:MAG: enoyl-CoA hydratase-related protein, partial [Chromatiales bacterium]